MTAPTVLAAPPVVPAGEQLERFLRALQPRWAGPRIAAALGVAPAACHVLDAKLEPGSRALVLYRHGDRLVRGDVAPSGGWRLHAFPHDPDLPQLPALMRGQTAGAVPAGRPVLLRYRPGKRATLLLRHAADGVVVKAYHDPAKAAAVHADSVALADRLESSGRLRLAPPLDHDPGLAVTTQREVAGRPLGLLLAGRRGPGRRAEHAVRLAAEALAELHATATEPRRRRDVRRELQRFRSRAAAVAAVAPAPGDAAGLLAERLALLEPQLPPELSRPVHGDCKPAQFLLTDEGAFLLDLDHVGISDPAGDVGTFVATLRQLALRRRPGRGTTDPALDRLAEHFVAAYLARASASPAERADLAARIAWQEAVALERKALRAFARAPRSPLVTDLVTTGHRRLDELEGT